MPNLYDFPNPFQGVNEGLKGLSSGLMQAQQMRGMQQQQFYQGLLGQKAQMDIQEAQKEQQNKEGLISAMQQPSDKSSWEKQADYWMTKGETNKALQAMQIGKAEEELNANPAALKYAKMITEIRKADKSGKLLKMMWPSIQTQFPKETTGTNIDELISYGQQGVTAKRIPNSNFVVFYNEDGERIEIKEDKPDKLSFEEKQSNLLTPEQRKEAALIKAGLKTGKAESAAMKRYVLVDETGKVMDEQWIDIKNPKKVADLVSKGYRSITTEDLLLGADPIDMLIRRSVKTPKQEEPLKTPKVPSGGADYKFNPKTGRIEEIRK